MKKNLIFTLIYSCLAQIAIAQTTTLKLNLEKGKTYFQRIDTEQKIAQNILGQNVDMTQTIGLGYKIDVLNKDSKGNMTWKITYNTVKMTQESAVTGKIEFDSEKSTQVDASNPLGMAMRALVGQTLEVVINSLGEITDVKGTEQMIESMIEKMGVTSEAQKQQMRESMKKEYGKDAVKNSFEGSFGFYPEKPVKIGDTWVRKAKKMGMQSMVLENTFKLLEIKNGMAKIEVNSKISPNTEDKNETKSEFSGKQTGFQWVDLKTGWVKDANLKQDLKGKVNFQGMDVEMNIESNIYIK
ncbi:MAG: DUF6263 family protein [Microscillaceae bacterium]|nr:DUF6263 family protein [Microscillaceae bacterium]MDW8460132.1 DUF6263 family protein [Cytophagales bacterium]